GRQRIAELYQQAMALLGSKQATPELTAAEGVERLQQAFEALQHDPLYRYELSFGQGVIPRVRPARPGLVLSRITGQRDGAGTWTAVDVIARCAESTTLRPVEISGRIVAQTGSVQHEAIDSFVAYGAPLAGASFSGQLQAPGGLDGSI